MVKQDTERTLARAAERRKITEERRVREKKQSGGWRLVAVQSIACVVIVLLALFARLGGGVAYDQLRDAFGDNLMRNDLLAALAAVWDGDPTVSLPPQEETAASTTTTTSTTAAGVHSTGGRLPPEGASAVAVKVNHPADLPLDTGQVTSLYGYRDNPTGEGEQFHRGIDIAAPQGTPLKAMFHATVVATGTGGSLGNFVTLQSGRTAVTYGHCAEISVARDAVVQAGDTVALVGATGDVTGSHVHIAVQVDGVYYNPCGILPVSRYA